MWDKLESRLGMLAGSSGVWSMGSAVMANPTMSETMKRVILSSACRVQESGCLVLCTWTSNQQSLVSKSELLQKIVS